MAYSIVKLPTDVRGFVPIVHVTVCLDCGGVVGDTTVHDQWHETMKNLMHVSICHEAVIDALTGADEE